MVAPDSKGLPSSGPQNIVWVGGQKELLKCDGYASPSVTLFWYLLLEHSEQMRVWETPECLPYCFMSCHVHFCHHEHRIVRCACTRACASTCARHLTFSRGCCVVRTGVCLGWFWVQSPIRSRCKPIKLQIEAYASDDHHGHVIWGGGGGRGE